MPGRQFVERGARVFLASVLVVTNLLLPAAPVNAQVPPPTVSFTPSSVPPGDPIQVSGSFFECEDRITVDIVPATGEGLVARLGTVFGPCGAPPRSWTQGFTVPRTVLPGQYRIRATNTIGCQFCTPRTAISNGLLTVTGGGRIISGFAACGDVRLPQATVELFSGTGLVATTTSNSDAFYSFDPVRPGRYTIRVTKGAQTCGGEVPSEGQPRLTTPIDLHNHSWPRAFELCPPDLATNCPNRPVFIDEHLFKLDQSAWFKFKVQPGSRVVVTLRGTPGFGNVLPANYDLTLYKDIASAYKTLTTPQDLMRLQAEVAPDAFSPDAFSPDAFSPDAFSPDAFSPDAFSPDAFSPDAFSPDAFSPDAFSPDAFSPDAFSPDAFSTDPSSPFNPTRAAPDAFSPDAFSGGETVTPAAYVGAQTRSLLAISAHNGTASEGIRKFVWDNTGDFYLRVRGRNGAFSLSAPFRLEVTQFTGSCGLLNLTPAPPTVTVPAGGYRSLFVTDSSQLPGTPAEKAALFGLLDILAARPEIAGRVVDVAADGPVAAARAQAQARFECPVAKNFLGERIKAIVDAARLNNPVEYVVLVGADDVIPFFRDPDQALLANENTYIPPVRDASASQASLRLGYVLGQDRYGSSILLSRGDHHMPLPDLAVGRLVESPADMTQIINAYLVTPDGVVPTPTSALVTGYDFFASGAALIGEQLGIGLNNPFAVDQLITPPQPNPPPLPNLAWTALDLRNQLLNTRHDIAFVGGHFSQATALAADYATRLYSTDVLSAPADLTNAIMFSEGCHSGYNTVDADAIPGVTIAPDFAQALNRRGATLIAGTGYQYGHTDFVEYGMRLYLEFSKQLRTGSGPVPLGTALVKAKRAYLANTPKMRGIHEKTILESTLFGLPQLQVDMPGVRLTPTPLPPLPTTPTVTDPGRTLGLASVDTTVNPLLTTQTKSLRNVANASTVTATWLSGRDGTLSNPGEPALPLEIVGASGSGSATVLRGVGLRSASYTDTPNVMPLIGVPATEASGPHGPFAAPAFYPVQPWSVNYLDALAGGAIRLAVTPAQYLTNPLNPLLATQRQFNSMTFRLFYSNNTTRFETRLRDQPNIPGLAAAPAISKVSGIPTADGRSVNFGVNVVGDPSAGTQQVWVTYTATVGPLAGQWQSLDLQRAAPPYSAANPSSMWRGNLSLPVGQNPRDVRYIVQAANGVGLVTLDTNLGGYFVPGSDAVQPTAPKQETRLVLNAAPTSGTYRESVTFSATLTSNGAPLANRRVSFGIGSQRRAAMTGADGSATVNMALLTTPDDYTLDVSFDETPDLLGSTVTAPLRILKARTTLTFGATPFVVILTDQSGRALREQTVFFTVSGAGGSISRASITDGAGRAILTDVPLPPGSYASVTANFLGRINLSTSSGTQLINLTNDHFEPAVKTWVGPPLTLTPAGPRCELTSLIPGPPTQLLVTVQDTNSGLLSVIPTEVVNFTLSIEPAFTIGDTRAVIITATMVDEALSARLALVVTNVAGTFTECDPVIVTLGNVPGVPRRVTVNGVAESESMLSIINGSPGVSALRIGVNGGKEWIVRHLKDGERRTVDLSGLLEGDDNSITLEVLGRPRGTVTVMISDPPNPSPRASAQPARRQRGQAGPAGQLAPTGRHHVWQLGD